jgi:carboxymethylenebutenolidase
MPSAQPEGYLALPRPGKGPGVLVLHAWWGLNDTLKGVCERLADEGFVAFAPDLYHGRLATTIEEAEILSSQLDGQQEQAMSDIAHAVDLLWARAYPHDGGLGVMGFSLGAYYALKLSTEDPKRVRAVVLFYGTGSADFSRSNAVYQGHFAAADPYEPGTNVDWLESALKSSGHPVTFYRYAGVGHWFFERDRADAYNEPAASLAWERAVAFLRDTLPSSPTDAAEV